MRAFVNDSLRPFITLASPRQHMLIISQFLFIILFIPSLPLFSSSSFYESRENILEAISSLFFFLLAFSLQSKLPKEREYGVSGGSEGEQRLGGRGEGKRKI